MLRAIGRVALTLLSKLFLLLILLTGLLIWRLDRGPLPMDWLAPLLRAQLTSGSLISQIEFGGVELAFDRGRGQMALRVRDVEARDPRDAPLLSAQSAAIKLRLAPLLIGVIEPTEIEVVAPALNFSRDASGRFSIDTGGDLTTGTPAAESSPALMGLLGLFVEGGERPPLLRSLQHVAIHQVSARFDDHVTGRQWELGEADILLNDARYGLVTEVTATVSAGDRLQNPLRLRAEILKPKRAGSHLRVTLRFSDAPVDAILELVPQLEALRVMDAPLSGHISLTIGPDGLPRHIIGALIAGKGKLRLGQGLALNMAELHLSYDAETQALNLIDVPFDIEGGKGRGSALMKLRLAAGGGLEAIDGRFEVVGLEISDQTLFDPPLKPDRVRAGFTVVVATQTVTLHDLLVEVAQLKLMGEGKLALRSDGHVGADVKLRMSEFPAKQLAGFWPVRLSSQAREWVRDYIKDGIITGGTIHTNSLGTNETLDIQFGFTKLAGQYLSGMPPITDAVGSGRVSINDFELRIERGRVVVPGYSAIDLSDARFRVPDFNKSDGEITLRTTGTLQASLALIDHPPLQLLQSFPLDLSQVRGQASTQLRLNLPLIENLTMDKVQVRVEGQVSDGALVLPGGGAPVQLTNLRVEANNQRLLASGSVSRDGIDGQLRWTEIFAPKRDEPRSHYAIALRLDADDLRKLGVPDGVVVGVLPLQLDIHADRGEPVFRCDVDLAAIALHVQPLGWNKPEGERGDLICSGRLSTAGTVLDQLELRTAGLRLKGSASFGSNAQSVTLTQLQLGNSTDLGLEWRQAEAGMARLDIRGAALDLRPLLRRSSGTDMGSTRLTLAVARATLTEAITLADLAGELELQPKGMIGTLRAKASGNSRVASQPVTIGFTPDSGVAIRAEDAGALLRAIGIYDHASGGQFRMNFDGTPAKGAEVSGRVVMDGIVIRNTPALAQIFNLLSVVGTPDAMDGGGLRFDRAEASFALKEDRLHIPEALASGPSVGMTMNGHVGLAQRELDLRGSFSPFYAINGLLNAIPIIGQVFTGGEGEGLIGVAWTATGPADNPRIEVNPLAVLTLGPLRKLFTASRDGEAAAPPPNINQ